MFVAYGFRNYPTDFDEIVLTQCVSIIREKVNM